MWSLEGQDGDAFGLRVRETVWTSRQVNSSTTMSSREFWYVCMYMNTYTYTYTCTYIRMYIQDDIAAQAHDLALSRRYTQLSFEPWHTPWTPQEGPLAHPDAPLSDGMRRMRDTSAPLPLPDCHTRVIIIINIYTHMRARTHTYTHVHTHAHTHMVTHTCAHTHTHIGEVNYARHTNSGGTSAMRWDVSGDVSGDVSPRDVSLGDMACSATGAEGC
jgi:hypothetical protein